MIARPLIGIPTQTLQSIAGIPEGLPASWVMNQRYYLAVAAAGGVPVMIPLFDEDVETLREIYDRLDGICIPGGVDMDPETFGEERRPECGRIDPPRDRVELQLTRWALDDEKPLLGLCRGLQVLNVALGGTLYQDLAADHPGAMKHDYFPTAGFARDYLSHEVVVTEGSRLAAVLGNRSLVNSMHHQGIRTLGTGLTAAAVAPDGLIEGVEADAPFCVGVQWHPETLTEADPRMARLFTEFVQAARSYSTVRGL
jgi:putative glutamine amidotransferase